MTPKLKSSILQMLAIGACSHYCKCVIPRGESHPPKDYGVYLSNKKRGKRK